MASSSSSTAKLHNFVVPKRARNYQPPSRPQVVVEDMRPGAAVQKNSLSPSPSPATPPKVKRSRMGAHAAKIKMKEEEKITNVKNNNNAATDKNRVCKTPNGEGSGGAAKAKEEKKLGKTMKVEENINDKNRVCKTPKGEGEGSGGATKEEEEEPKKRKKLGITIPLNKWEIEQDIYAFTGRKPSNHPMKYSKAVQKDLEGTFPGEL